MTRFVTSQFYALTANVSTTFARLMAMCIRGINWLIEECFILVVTVTYPSTKNKQTSKKKTGQMGRKRQLP